MDCKIFNEEEQEIIKGGIKPTVIIIMIILILILILILIVL